MGENIDFSKNIEINEALKEFEEKSQIEQTQKTPSILKNPETSKMAQWIMKISGGAIKKEQQAEYVLLGFAVLAIIVSLFFMFGGNINTGQNKTPAYPIYKYQEDLTPSIRETLPKEVLDKIPYKYGK